VSLQKYVSHPSLVIYFFTTPPIKLKLGQQTGKWGTTNSKPLGPIIMMSRSEALSSSSQIIFITLFCAGAQVGCGPCTSHKRLCGAKTILLSQTGMF
jgi:hypothetical protein